MADELVLYDVAERVATITLNRPEKRNALNRQLWTALEAALGAADADRAVRAVVLAARGPTFCAGADLAQGMSGAPVARRTALDTYESQQEGVRRHRLFRDLAKPIVAAVQGQAIAWGLELACLCDFVFASEQARFGAPAIRHGVFIGSLLPWLVGIQNARYLWYTGDLIDAREAYRIGLAFRVVPHEQLGAEAHRFARRLVLIPPAALRLNKRQLDGALEMAGMYRALEYGALAAALVHAVESGDEAASGRSLREVRAREGLGAFLTARDTPFDG
ncbi:MAG TPA: enoyl-CoA hydratase/isomerase family protein [Chloroflexota bacterium]|nr:enoyl-CoA hydratase/isomerase family protein [Chloroflexota bacterium]